MGDFTHASRKVNRCELDQYQLGPLQFVVPKMQENFCALFFLI